MPKQTKRTLSINSYTYTALFCEENIWLLAKSLHTEGLPLESMQVLFLSNPAKQIVLFDQKSVPLGKAVVWDYHVILWAKTTKKSLIFDFDSRLPFPCPASQYVHSSFPNPQTLPEKFHFYIRQIPAANYLQQFYSDRKHMQNQIPVDQFPRYKAIQANPTYSGIALQDYWDMDKQLEDKSKVYPYTEIFEYL